MAVNVKALALTLGLLWGGGMFVLGIAAALTGWGAGLVDPLASLYIGFDATLTGSLIGAAWGLVDGAIFGGLIAWLYNVFDARL